VKLEDDGSSHSDLTDIFVSRVVEVRDLHCRAMWETIRIDSLETPSHSASAEAKEDGNQSGRQEGQDRREWLGYSSKEEEGQAKARFQDEKSRQQSGLSIEEISQGYDAFESMPEQGESKTFESNGNGDERWKGFWEEPQEN
jgi:hypothetical protein